MDEMAKKQNRVIPKKESSQFRPAAGTKFKFLLDAYLYALAQSGEADEVSAEAHSWYAVLLDGEQLYEALDNLAASQDFDLKLTAEEANILWRLGGAIIMEDSTGFVEVIYYDDLEECEVSWEALLRSENRNATSAVDGFNWDDFYAKKYGGAETVDAAN